MTEIQHIELWLTLDEEAAQKADGLEELGTLADKQAAFSTLFG